MQSVTVRYAQSVVAGVRGREKKSRGIPEQPELDRSGKQHDTDSAICSADGGGYAGSDERLGKIHQSVRNEHIAQNGIGALSV